MGNTASSSGKHAHSHNIRDETVDFGHLSPQGIYTGPQDWNQEIVGKLIVDRKLAPFYRPLEDYEPDWDDEAILRNRKLKQGEQALPAPVTMSVSALASAGKGSAKGKGVADRREPQKMSEVEVYRGAIECPICFMYYPSNINRSRCCDQAICTECFVQIKRNEPTTTHLVSEPAACPYCVQENFGVTYEPPNWRAGLVLNSSSSGRPELPRLGGSAVSSGAADSQGHLTAERSRRKSAPHQAREVVTIDYIRPDWEAKLEAVRAAVARRANRRIVMRQVGDRLIPVGITSGRVVPVNVAEGETGGSGRRSRRQRNAGSADLPMGMTGHDLEELMMMEAMRLSLLEHEAQQRREREAQAANQATNSNPDSTPPRETANASPDPASELQQQEREQNVANTDPLLTVANAGLPPSSGFSTPLQPNSSGALEPVSDNSPGISPRQSFDTSQAAPPSHRRIGSGPIQVASSPLGGAAALAMAVGLPSTSDGSAPGNPPTAQSGFPPRTLNTLSAAVGAASIPAAILGLDPTDRPEIELGGKLVPNAEHRRDDQAPAGSSTEARPPSIERQNQSIAATSVPSPPVQENVSAMISHDSGPVTSPPGGPVPKPTSDPDNPPGLLIVSPAANEASSPSPVADRDPDFGNSSSATFLTADARAFTETSVRTVDSQQSKGESYNVLLSSPETEIDQPLMSRPSNLARHDTEDSGHVQTSGSNAV